MSDAFAQIRQTIDHANTQALEAGATADAFFKTDPYEIRRDKDPSYAGREIHCLYLKSPLPFRVSGLAADAVKTLRSALDHIGFAIATARGRSQGKNAHFPFGDSSADIEHRRKGRSKDIPKEIFDLMASFKPYQGGNDTLWRINKLANANKHEVTVKAVLAASNLTYEFGDGGIWLATGRRDGADDKIPVFWGRTGENPDYKLQISPTIRFNDIGNLKFDTPAIALLNDMSSVVASIAGAVETESKRLGII